MSKELQIYLVVSLIYSLLGLLLGWGAGMMGKGGDDSGYS